MSRTGYLNLLRTAFFSGATARGRYWHLGAWVGVGVAFSATGCGDGVVLGDSIWTDSFVQPEASPVDVLFVVDNSQSMQGENGEQQRVIAAFDEFIANIEESNIEFHIGVTTTDMEDPQYQRPGTQGRLVPYQSYLYITHEMDPALYRSVFEGMIDTVGAYDGTGFEKGLYAAKTALFPTSRGGNSGDGGYNEGFLRDDAKLAIIFVSDEDDCSDDGGLEMDAPEECYSRYNELRPASEYVRDYQSLKRSDDLIAIGSIVGPTGLDPESDCAKNTGEGRRYITVTDAFYGQVGSICQSDFSSILQDMGLAAAGILTRFPLSRAADPASIKVEVDDVEVPSSAGWSYDAESQSVIFQESAAPARGTTVVITYKGA